MSKIKKLISFSLKHKWLIPLEILSIIIILGIVFILSTMAYVQFLEKDYANNEKIVDKRFHDELASLPQIQVSYFKLWEGDAMVSLNIQDKGPVSLYYSPVPTIVRIGKYYIPFTCFYVDNNGSRTGYAYNMGLSLSGNHRFTKWFLFSVNNLHDLVDKYDAIIQGLSTFPKNPEMIEFGSDTDKRPIVKDPNPDFTLVDKRNGKDIACNLYVTTDEK